MKKIFTFFALLVFVAFEIEAQTFALYTAHPGGSIVTGTVTNNALLSYSTVINSEAKQRFRIKNTSTTNTYTYNIKRTIIAQNPLLTVSGVSVAPQTYFCAGIQCYDNSVATQTNVAEMTVLAPDSTSDAVSNPYPFLVYLDEGSTLGYYAVRYKVFNQTVPGDTITFTMKYNDYLGVNEIGSVIAESGDVFPNPVSNNATVQLSLKQESSVTMNVFNSLGTLVYSDTEQKLSQGKHKFSVDCSGLAAGVYVLQINSGNDKVTKRFVLEK